MKINLKNSDDLKNLGVVIEVPKSPFPRFAKDKGVDKYGAKAYEEKLGEEDEQIYYRAEVHLGEGGQDYDIMGWSKDAVIHDVIDQYHKHQHFLHLLR